jgi:hypothetical protein
MRVSADHAGHNNFAAEVNNLLALARLKLQASLYDAPASYPQANLLKPRRVEGDYRCFV